ncbi:MAG: nucleotide exchange factor GrpE [Gammaproteobacteria bacterium]
MTEKRKNRQKQAHVDVAEGQAVTAEASVDGGSPGNGEEQQAAISRSEDGNGVVTLADELDIEALKQTIENLRQQADENIDKAMRAHAEMENLRKRTQRDIENAHKYALDRFLKELLPVIDSMELGISASDDANDSTALREGMNLTLQKFLDTLMKFGVMVIDPRDEKFNPEKHEAVSMQDDKKVESGTVISVMQKGYELNGRLVRPAMVIVAK